MKQRYQLGGSQFTTASLVQARSRRQGANRKMGNESNRGTPGAEKAPTFALLQEKRLIRVKNPEDGTRFTISLRDWQEMLWAVRVLPEPEWRAEKNPFTTAHRILPRPRIEDWLAELRLV